MKYTRVTYVQRLKDILPSSDYVSDGTKEPGKLAEEIRGILNNVKVQNLLYLKGLGKLE